MKKWIFIFSLMFYCIATNANIYATFNDHSIGFVDAHYKNGEKYSASIRKRYHRLVNKQLYGKQPNCAVQRTLTHLPLWCNKASSNQAYLTKSRQTTQQQPYVFEITIPTKKQLVLNGAAKQSLLRAQTNPLLSKRAIIIIAIGALLVALLQVYFCWRQTKFTQIKYIEN